MKEKSKSIIQAVIGAVIMIIGIVLCVNTYVVKGNKEIGRASCRERV